MPGRNDVSVSNSPAQYSRAAARATVAAVCARRLMKGCRLRIRDVLLIACCGVATWVPAVMPASAQGLPATASEPRTGEEVYLAACAACHGADGRGTAPETLSFEVAVPDFTDCSYASPEAAVDWEAVVHQGGRVRAFDRHMPAFGEALSEREIALVVSHVRTFCRSTAWPPGELNFPRSLVTEKAFPENEALLTTSVTTGAGRALINAFLYERRVGARAQYEISVPVVVQRGAAGAWARGLGDVEVAFKRVMSHSLETGRILSLGGAVTMPTGPQASGVGRGYTVVEPFALFGQVLPRNGFVQFQGGAEFPVGAAGVDQPDELFWRTSVGTSLVENRFGRVWSPALEILGSRDLEAGAAARWDLVPQMQVTISKRQHMIVSGGVQVPLTRRSERGIQVLTYFLWDWFDGGFLDGWR